MAKNKGVSRLSLVQNEGFKRIFFGVALPDETISAIGDLLETVGDIPQHYISWMHLANIHITIKFLGDVEESNIERIQTVASDLFARFEPMELAIKGMGMFPNHDSPKIVWLGVTGEVDRLAHMESVLSKELAGEGFLADQRPFKAHLTIGRVKNENVRGPLIRLAREHMQTKIGPAPVKKITLYESKLRPSGAVYSALEVYKLKP